MTQQYLYWDASKSTYIPVDQSGTAAASEQATEVAFEVAAAPPPPPPPAENKEVKPKAVVKTAAQIAKVSFQITIASVAAANYKYKRMCADEKSRERNWRC